MAISAAESTIKPQNLLEWAQSSANISNLLQQNKLLQADLPMHEARAEIFKANLQNLLGEQAMNKLIAKNYAENKGVGDYNQILAQAAPSGAAYGIGTGLAAKNTYGKGEQVIGPSGESRLMNPDVLYQKTREASVPDVDTEESNAKAGRLAGDIISAKAKGENLTQKDLQDMVALRVEDGTISPEGANQFLSSPDIKDKNGKELASALDPYLQKLKPQDVGGKGLQIGLGTGEAGALSQDVAAFERVNSSIQSTPQQEMAIKNATEEVDKALTGAGSQGLVNAKSALITLIGEENADKVMPLLSSDKVAASQKLRKYLAQAVATQREQLGLKTDLGLMKAEEGSPNMEQNETAIRDLISQMAGVTAAQRILQKETSRNNFALNNKGFNKFYSDFNTNLDLRALGDSPETRAERIDNLEGAERKRYLDTLRLAHKYQELAPRGAQ